MTLTVRTITSAQHQGWADSQKSLSFLQLPSWGSVKRGWRAQSVGWFDSTELVGAALILYRPVPRMPKRSLAYIPEFSADWVRPGDDWAAPLIAHVRAEGAFQLKIGPAVATRFWEADTLKARIADGYTGRIADIPADRTNPDSRRIEQSLQANGFSQEKSDGAGFGDVQPRFVFQVPLAGRTLDDVFAGFNQQWRRNIRKSEKANVVVRQGEFGDLPEFHKVYVETAARDHFTPRALAYFELMWNSLNSNGKTPLTLYMAEHEGRVVAATIMVIVGDHAWYSYGASTTADRDLKPSNALQWRMICDAHAAGCNVYDLRGISDSLDPTHHLFGLIQFKLGTGGFVQEYLGEWDRIIRPLWAKGFSLYQSRKG